MMRRRTMILLIYKRAYNERASKCHMNWYWFDANCKSIYYNNFFLITGAFLIPFMIMLVLEGIPLFLIELGIGQRMRLGCLGVWNTIHPWLGGIGISSCIVTLFVAIYYNVIITWCIYYFINSFRVSSDVQPPDFLSITIVVYSSRYLYHGPNALDWGQTIHLSTNA